MSKLQNVNDYIKEHGLKPGELEIELGHDYDKKNDVTWLYVYGRNKYMSQRTKIVDTIPLQGKIKD